MHHKKEFLLLLVTIVLLLAYNNIFSQTKGDLQITCNPGLRIYIDNNFAGKSHISDDGLYIEGLDVGKHSVRIEKSGFITHTYKITIEAKEAIELKVGEFTKGIKAVQTGDEDETEMTSQVGNLIIRSVPLKCTIYFAGLDIKKIKSKVELTDIPVGTYKIKFARGKRELTYTFEIKGGKTIELKGHFNKGRVIDETNSALPNNTKSCGVITYEGKTYNTVQIGDQCWLKENLDVGTMIISDSSNSNQTNNNIIEKYCYENKEFNCKIYGGLYQWNEAMQYVTTEWAQGICPDGWHIPSQAEFEIFKKRVSSNSNDFKAVGEGEGTNTSGFSALLVGTRSSNGAFKNLDDGTNFWTSTETSSSSASIITINYGPDINYYSSPKTYGYSIRCTKD